MKFKPRGKLENIKIIIHHATVYTGYDGGGASHREVGGGGRTYGAENFLGPRPLRLWETPILKIEIRPFEYRDTPFLDKKRQMKSFLYTTTGITTCQSLNESCNNVK